MAEELPLCGHLFIPQNAFRNLTLSTENFANDNRYMWKEWKQLGGVLQINIPFSKLTRLSLKDRLLPHQIAIFVDGRWFTWPRIYWHQYTSRDQGSEQGLLFMFMFTYSTVRVIRRYKFNVHWSVHRNNILVYNYNKMHKSQNLFNP